jgi:dynein heavy chain
VESAITTADGQVAEHKESNLEELTKKINEEREKISTQNEKLSSENLLTKSTPFKEALDELARTKKKFDESVRR